MAALDPAAHPHRTEASGYGGPHRRRSASRRCRPEARSTRRSLSS